jgi:hypothetical protein
MQGAIALGNEKPRLLGLTEKALWRSFMQASLTGDSTAALNGFIAEFQDLHTRFNGPEISLDWYSANRE